MEPSPAQQDTDRTRFPAQRSGGAANRFPAAAALVALLVLLTAAATWADVRRYVVAAGANDGGAARQMLRYAVSDAERFAGVMVRMGGVDESDRVILREPGLDELLQALTRLNQRLRSHQSHGTVNEVFFYYSGHANEAALLLGEDQLSYSQLRQAMDQMDAEVRIAILDACASGSITRIKGGQPREAFLVDAASRARGYAFLTSSSAAESAQESDLIGASFFTHFLVSGMQGAADVSGDRRITLTEAYGFAFNETLSRTVETQGGAQHPAYHLNLSGTGDVVLTDVRRTSARIALQESMSGRFFVRNASNQLIAELYKPSGRVVELGLEPGRYSVHLERDSELLVSTPTLASGQRLVLEEASFRRAPRQPASIRGLESVEQASPYGTLARRSRLELRVGRVGPAPRDAVVGSAASARVGTWGMAMGLTYARWLSEDLAATASATLLSGNVDVDVGDQIRTEVVGLASLLLGVRAYRSLVPQQPEARPYLSASVGTFLGSMRESQAYMGGAVRAGSVASAGGQLGAGVDLQLSRRMMLGVQAGYNLMLDFSEELGGRRNYSGPEIQMGCSVLFGKGPDARRYTAGPS